MVRRCGVLQLDECTGRHPRGPVVLRNKPTRPSDEVEGELPEPNRVSFADRSRVGVRVPSWLGNEPLLWRLGRPTWQVWVVSGECGRSNVARGHPETKRSWTI